MKASELIKDKIKTWEGLRLRAYRCPGGVLTIGYGHTGPEVAPGQSITPAEAQALFEQDLGCFELELNELLKKEAPTLRLTQARYDALLSLAYNIGLSALKGSTLWGKLKQAGHGEADTATLAAQFGRWVFAAGRRLPGLVRRRASEARIFANADYSV